MDTNLDRAYTRLAQGRFMHIDGGPGRSVTVVRGQLWATQFRDRRDVILGVGQSLELDRPGPALIEALVGSVVLVLGPAGAGVEQSGLHDWLLTRPLSGWDAQQRARRLRNQALVQLCRNVVGRLRDFWFRTGDKSRSPVGIGKRAGTGAHGNLVTHHARPC